MFYELTGSNKEVKLIYDTTEHLVVLSLDGCTSVENSHKYKSLKSTEVNGIKLEIFEWCSKYHVRLYGNSENFVDIYIGENKVFAESLYQSQSDILMLVLLMEE